MNLSLVVFRYYFFSWITNLFIIYPGNARQFAAKNLFQPTFRVPQSERNSFFLVIKYFLRFIYLFISKTTPKDNVLFLSTSKNDKQKYIYDINVSTFEERKKYVEYFSGDLIDGAVFKEHLAYVESRKILFLLMFLNCCWLPFLFLYSFFKKDKAPVANLFREQLECYNLISLLKSNNVKSIYHFCIYEKDSNINTLLLQNYRIKVFKIPSEVPLGVWNQIIIADKLCLCMGYQYDELKAFRKSIFVDDVGMFGPEKCLLNIEKYKHDVKTEKNCIGFYSTGAWVRKLENHNDQGFDMEEKEEEVKLILADFCEKNHDYKLYVFLHPREKWDKYKQQTQQRYAKIFSGIQYELSEKDSVSSLLFEKVDLGVAFQSTIVYERLYYGFKTLIMPMGKQSFPVADSNMKNICSEDKDQLYEQIKKSVSQTNVEFFESNGIKHFAQYLYN